MSRPIDSSGLTSFAIPGAKIGYSAGGNALTLSIQNADGTDPSPRHPLFIAMQHTSGDGALYEGRIIAAPLSVTLSPGSTMGFLASTAGRLWLLVIDDAGTLRLGVRNCVNHTTVNSYPLSEYGVMSSVAEGGAGAADSAGVTYTNIAVTNKPFRIAGYVDFSSGLGIAGNWGAPDVRQMMGVGIHRPGDIVQMAPNYSASILSSVATIPFDDTTPQSNEGDPWLSQTIDTPGAPNILAHEAKMQFGSTVSADQIILALHQGPASPAIDALSVAMNEVNAGGTSQITLGYRHIANNGPATYYLRFGTKTGIEITVNGLVENRLFGGRMFSSYEIREVMA